MTSLLTTFLTSTASASYELPCHDIDAADLFFAERPADLEQAKALCRSCPLLEACRDGALERGEPWGVWGGRLCEHGAFIAVKRGRCRPRTSAAGAAGRAPARRRRREGRCPCPLPRSSCAAEAPQGAAVRFCLRP